MEREKLLEQLESALAREDWDYVQQLKEVLLTLGDQESLDRIEAILTKAKDLQSQNKLEDNKNNSQSFKTERENKNQLNRNRPVLNLSDPLPKPRLALSIRDKSKLVEVESGSLSIYKLPLTKEMREPKSMLAKYSFGKADTLTVPEKVLMVVGATGAGKTTLINGIVNYIIGVEWKDDFRFKMILDEANKSQAHSQTKFITAYTIHKTKDSLLPYTLTIIDTPGYGDTKGAERDKFITSQIREFFSMQNGIDHLDGIGFVTQSALARLTPTQKYIFHSILSIFGKDVANNIFMMVTFADGQKPPVIDAVKEAEVPYSKFFKFNNSALFANNNTEDDEEDDNFDEMFWKMGVKSFSKFFTSFEKAESKSLQLTRGVLKERKQLEATVLGLQPRINEGLSKLDELRQEEIILKQRQAEIEANKNFTYKINVTKQRKIDLSRGEYVTNCLICNCTCHYPCFIPKDEYKNGCAAMNSNGYCNVCSCYWDQHVNNGYRFELYDDKETRTSEELRKKYKQAVSGKSQVESMISNIENYLENVAEEVFAMVMRVQGSIKRLDQIALRPDPLTETEYLETLIESEKREKKAGWKQRISFYEKAKEQARILSKLKNNDDESLNQILSRRKSSSKPKVDFKSWVENLKFWE